MADENTFTKDVKIGTVGVMKMIDALIEMGYYITPSSDKLDKELKADIIAWKVDTDNIERWRNGKPIPTGIDVKYVKNGPASENKRPAMFFEVDNKKSKYGTRNGWGMYEIDHFRTDENFKNWENGNDVVLRIAYVQQDAYVQPGTDTHEEIACAKDVDTIEEIYKCKKKDKQVGKQDIIITPLVYMQRYYLMHGDESKTDNHCSKLQKVNNGLLMPLKDYEKHFTYSRIKWNRSSEKWDTEKHGTASIPNNKPGSKKIKFKFESEKDLQAQYDDQLQQMKEGTLDYKLLLRVEYLGKVIARLEDEIKRAYEQLKQQGEV